MNKSEKLAVIILAAGRGTRMKSDLPKVLHKLAGRPMINWLIDRVQRLNPTQLVVVIGPDMNDLKEAVAPHETVIQTNQNGTADAVKPALKKLAGFEGRVLILLGDEPLVDTGLLKKMVAHNGPAVMAVEPPDNFGYGRMIVDDNHHLQKIVEEKDANEEERQVRLCNAGNFCLDMADLQKWLPEIDNNNAQNEYYLTDLPPLAVKDGQSFQVFSTPCAGHWGINSRAELAAHETTIQNELRAKHMANGVTLVDPATTYISYDTEIGSDTIIGPNVFFGPGVQVAENVTIDAFCHLEGCVLEAGCTVGPFARIRPKSKIGEGAGIGNFCEVNRSTINAGAKSKHVSYLGDAVIGAKSNIGAGTVIANYDGFLKHQTEIGANVFVGSNTTIVSPVKIDDGAILAAASCITKDIPKDALAVARAKQENQEGRAAIYRARKQKEKDRQEK
jgi:bifunctional UDP-N-acetylglucosamine pyrophosphorylase/glucosamine-1-phosphate N-acetyltransferase